MSSPNDRVMTALSKRYADRLRKAWPLLPGLLYLFGFQIIVMCYLLVLSLSVSSGNGQVFSCEPFSRVLGDSRFLEALLNTTMFTFIGTPLELLAGLLFAALLYRSFPLRNVVRSIFLIPLALPALVTAMLIYVLFDFPGGHVNHFLLGNYPPFPQLIGSPVCWRGSHLSALSLSLIGKVWRDMPISMLILLAGLNGIDPELLDAAKTMGATLRQRFSKIMLPLIIPSVSAVVLLRSVEMWKEFIFPYVLAGRYRFLGTLIDYYYNDFGNPHYAAVVALVMVACIIATTVMFGKTLDFFKSRSGFSHEKTF